MAVDAADLPRVEGVPARGLRAGSPRATATPPTTCWRSPPSAGAGAADPRPGRPDLLAETVFSARREQARSVGDALLRRTRLALLAARDVSDPGGETALRVARAMAPELGWDEARAGREAQAFLDEAAAEGIVARDDAAAYPVSK